MNPWIHKWQMFPSSVWASCRGRRQPDSTRLPSVGRIMDLFATSPVQQQPVTKDFKKETEKCISLGNHIRTLPSTVMALLWFWRHNTGVRLTYLSYLQYCRLFQRPFVKWFTYAIYVCLSVCAASDVGVLWPNGCMHQVWCHLVWVGLGPGHIVLHGDPAPPLKRGTAASQFSANVSCGQTAGWIKMPLGREVNVGPGDIVLDGDPAPPPESSTAAHLFSSHVCCGQTVAHLSYC